MAMNTSREVLMKGVGAKPDDVRAAFGFAKKRYCAPGATMAERLAADQQAHRDDPDGYAASALVAGRLDTLGTRDMLVTFKGCVAILSGERSIGSADPGTIALLEDFSMMSPAMKAALAETGSPTTRDDLKKVGSPRSYDEAVALAKAAGESLGWREVVIEAMRQNGTTRVTIPIERLSLLSAWRAGRTPTGFMFSVGGVSVAPSEILWTGFETSLAAHGRTVPGSVANRAGA